MYITDRKTKECVASYIRHHYGAHLEPNRIYVFKYDYEWDIKRGEYVVSKYKDYVSHAFPERIPAKDVDDWGMILSRKEKIEKIQKNGNKEKHRRMVGC